MIKKKKLCLSIAMSMAASTLAIGAENSKNPMLEEVFVTATKRSKSVHDIPYNISAFSGENMERAGITDMSQLARNIPGIAFLDKGPQSAGAFANSIAMRGLNVDSADNNSDRPGSTAPTVATYVGNTPMFTSLRLKDIQRVEVLRGPQGTLYGSGAMGGIVRLVQNQPELDETSLKLSTRISQTDESDGFNYETDVIFNVPISESFAIRGHLGKVDNDGFIDAPSLYQRDANGAPILANPSDPVNSLAATESKKDVNEEDIINGRVSALWDASNNTSVTMGYSFQRDEIDGAQSDTSILGEYNSAVLQDEPFERDVDLLTLDVESDFGFATMTVALSHTEIEGELVRDVSTGYSTDGVLGDSLNFPGFFGSGVDLYTEYYGNNPRMLVHSGRVWDDEVDSLEIRLASNTEGSIDWLFGFNYLKQEVNFRQEDSNFGRNDYVNAVNNAGATLIGQDGTPAVAPGFFTGTTPNDLVYFFDNSTEFTDQAFFGELTYHFSDDWQITTGLRYFDQEFEAIQNGGIVAGGFVGDGNGTFEESDTLFKVNTSYDITDQAMLFFTWAEGFRRGGVNAVPTALINPDRGEALEYESDEVTSTEIGIKGSFNDWDYTATVFKIDWDNAQINTSLTPLALIGVTNIPEAETQGIELELQGHLTESLSINFGYSYVDSEVLTSIAQENRLAITGTPLPIPKHTASLALTYFQSLDNDAELVWGVNASYRDDTPSGTEATEGTNGRRYTVYDSFTLVDASVVLNTGPWSVTGFINNVSNQRGTLGGNPITSDGPFGEKEAVVRPRTIGMGLTYTFMP